MRASELPSYVKILIAHSTQAHEIRGSESSRVAAVYANRAISHVSTLIFTFKQGCSLFVFQKPSPDIIPRTKSAAFSLYTRPAENLAISRPAENLAISRPALETIPSRRWTRLSNREIRTALPAGRLWINPLPLTLSHGYVYRFKSDSKYKQITRSWVYMLSFITRV